VGAEAAAGGGQGNRWTGSEGEHKGGSRLGGRLFEGGSGNWGKNQILGKLFGKKNLVRSVTWHWEQHRVGGGQHRAGHHQAVPANLAQKGGRREKSDDRPAHSLKAWEKKLPSPSKLINSKDSTCLVAYVIQ